MQETNQENNGNNAENTDIKVYVGSTSIFDDKEYSKKEKLSRIKEILSKALQIDNLNFLLGAGCSSYLTNQKECEECQKNYKFECNKLISNESVFDCGIPIMSGLIKKFKKLKNNFEIVGLKLNDKMLKDVFGNNLENILEYLQSLYLVTSKINNKQKIYYKKNDIENDILSDDIQKDINIIKNFIINEILEHDNTLIVIELYKLFYQKIINKNRKNPINIFTTNYDLYNETALDRLNFLYNNGFSGTVERKFNPMLYKYIYVENMNLNKDVWEPVSYFFNLIKLHGSISWEADREKLEIYENNNLKNLKDNVATVDKVMIYPSPLKDRSTLMTPYSDLFRFLENSLYLNNSTLIVIGYSFGDEHINRVIFNALANPTFRLIIFGDSDNIKNLIKRNDKRITIIYSQKIENNNNKKEEFEPIHYFKYIVNNLLPSVNDDILEKERIDKIIKFLKENKLV